MVKTVWMYLCVFGVVVHADAQDFVFNNVTKLPAVVNSSAEESFPLLTPDGKRLYFARALYSGNEGGEFAGQDIWYVERKGNTWVRGDQQLRVLNNRNNNVVVGFGAKNKKLYYTNGSPYQRLDGIYAIPMASGSKKSRSELLRIPELDNLDFIGFYVSPDLDVILLSMRGLDSEGKEDLYYTIKDATGAWVKPRTLGATINTKGFEISPFLSADKKRLYFASNGHPGEGDADIFYSERLYDSWETWGVPVNLGKSINSSKFDAYFSLYGDSLAFFSSNRGSRYADLYQADVEVSKTVLAKNQRYMTTEEWDKFVGKNVSSSFAFPNGSSLLSQGQKELLFYIVNKLMLERDVQFHLVVKEQESVRGSEDRLQAIVTEMKRQGIDPSRIIISQTGDPESTSRGVIEVRLFR